MTFADRSCRIRALQVRSSVGNAGFDEAGSPATPAPGVAYLRALSAKGAPLDCSQPRASFGKVAAGACLRRALREPQSSAACHPPFFPRTLQKEDRFFAMRNAIKNANRCAKK